MEPNTMKRTRFIGFWMIVLLLKLASVAAGQPIAQELHAKAVWVADLQNGNYQNPIIHADYSDPDVVRVGDDYYMTASSFNCVPGLPILHSRDLVNWTIISHGIKRLEPDESFRIPQHGNGVWAPAFRYHNNHFYIFWGDPDYGIYMIRARDPAGPWSDPHLVKSGRGWIDPCPLWDDDGKAYLVHAWAGSRSGIKSVLIVHRMDPDGTRLLDDGVMVFDGHEQHRTVEGPKFYKLNGYYYILAPAGGVTSGWQLALRSRNVLGPYEVKTVMHQGNTNINGPHQGGLVETKGGEHWFVHFQDTGPYGRVVHLNPVTWQEDWPLMGVDINSDGIGEPVSEYRKPVVNGVIEFIAPQTSDEFDQPALGPQWQWHANPDPRWGWPTSQGFLRLNCIWNPDPLVNLWTTPNLLLQKFPARAFSATAKIEFHPSLEGDEVGLVVMGSDYGLIALNSTAEELFVEQKACFEANNGSRELTTAQIPMEQSNIYLRVTVDESAICQFSYSLDGDSFTRCGDPFEAKQGKWIGAKVGLFCRASNPTNDSGYVNIDWFRFDQ